MKKNLLIASIASLVIWMNGCALSSAYTGLIFGGEDMVNAVKDKHPSLVFPAFFLGTALGPVFGLFNGFCGDLHALSHIDTLFNSNPHIDYPSNCFDQLNHPITKFGEK